MAVNYRLDRVERLPAGADYTAPVGMNTLVQVFAVRPDTFSIMKKISAYAGKVYILSKYNLEKRDFEVIQILNPGA